MLILGMITGAGLFGSGWLAGRLGRRRLRSPVPECGCGHHYSYHDPETGQCHGTDRKTKYSSIGADLGYHEIPCTCRRYSGPQPLPEYFAPEIAA